MGQRHVARAEPVELPQRGEDAAHLPPALDADHRGHLALLVDADDVVRSSAPFEVVGVSGNHPIDDVDLVDGPRIASSPVIAAVDIDRPELPADAAGEQPRHVGHQRFSRAICPSRWRARRCLKPCIFLQLLGDVVVAVDQRRFLEDTVDARLDLGIDRLLGGERSRGEKQRQSIGTNALMGPSGRMTVARVYGASDGGAMADHVDPVRRCARRRSAAPAVSGPERSRRRARLEEVHAGAGADFAPAFEPGSTRPATLRMRRATRSTPSFVPASARRRPIALFRPVRRFRNAGHLRFFLRPTAAFQSARSPAIVAGEQYELAVEQVREHLFAGDFYQANLTFGCDVTVAGDPLALYARLRGVGASGLGRCDHA